jgi:hypothetical protein
MTDKSHALNQFRPVTMPFGVATIRVVALGGLPAP